jgi:hypothetical protein
MRYSEDEVRLYALARERSLIDDVEGVAEALRQLVQLRPDSALFNASLANALNSLGQVDVAEHLFKKGGVTCTQVREDFPRTISLPVGRGKTGRSARRNEEVHFAR